MLDVAAAMLDGVTHSSTLEIDSASSEQSKKCKVCLYTADRGILQLNLDIGRAYRLIVSVHQLLVDDPLRIIALGRARHRVLIVLCAEKRGAWISCRSLSGSDHIVTSRVRQHRSQDRSIDKAHRQVVFTSHPLPDRSRPTSRGRFPTRFPPAGRFPRYFPGRFRVLPATGGRRLAYRLRTS